MLPVVSVVCRSNSGKTTLLEKLLRELTGRGRRVGTIKHHREGPVAVDVPGKDSWRHTQAGARTVVLASAERGFAVWHAAETSLDTLVHRFFWDVDLVLTEGFKSGAMPKIEVSRRALGVPLLCGPDDQLVAVAADWATDAPVPHFGLDAIGPLADFVETGYVQRAIRPAVELLVGGRRVALDPEADRVLAGLVRSVVGTGQEPPLELRIAGRLP
jgi:molybdopterin-guanine dinucleotide biosynthesis protein MobB